MMPVRNTPSNVPAPPMETTGAHQEVRLDAVGLHQVDLPLGNDPADLVEHPRIPAPSLLDPAVLDLGLEQCLGQGHGRAAGASKGGHAHLDAAGDLL